MDAKKRFDDYLPIKKVNLQNYKPLLPVILQIFDLKCHGQTSVKVAFVIFGLIFIKFRKLKSLHRENKKLDLHKV